MASQVIGVREAMDAREMTQGKDWKRTYTRAFRVLTNDPTMGPASVYGAARIQIGYPYWANQYEFDFGAFCNSISVKPEGEDGVQWRVTYEYGPYDPSDFPADPTQWPIQVSFGFDQYERVCEEDIDGNAVTNSATDYFDPPVMIDDSRPLMTITRNEQTYDSGFVANYKNAINSDPFWNEAEYSWMCKDISGEFTFDPDSPQGYYYKVTYQFVFNPDTWLKSLLDQGFRQLDTNGAQQEININGQAPSSPVLLDGNGQILPAGSEPVFLEFHVFQEQEFSKLNLDPSMLPGYQGSWQKKISGWQANPGQFGGTVFGQDF